MPHYNLPHNHGQNIERVLNKMPHTEDFTDIAFLFQQLGDPTRLRILWLLCHCDECVCNIAAAVDMSAPAVSHHLRILKKSGIISSRRDGKDVIQLEQRMAELAAADAARTKKHHERHAAATER